MTWWMLGASLTGAVAFTAGALSVAFLWQRTAMVCAHAASWAMGLFGFAFLASVALPEGLAGDWTTPIGVSAAIIGAGAVGGLVMGMSIDAIRRRRRDDEGFDGNGDDDPEDDGPDGDGPDGDGELEASWWQDFDRARAEWERHPAGVA